MNNYTRRIFFLSIFSGAMLAAAGSDAPQGTATLPGLRDSNDLQSAGFRPLFDGKSFDGWELKPWHEGHFTIREGGVMHYDGQAEGKRGQDKNLWTTKSFGDFTFYVEWRLPREPALKGQPIVLYNGDFLMEEDNPKQRVMRMQLDAGDSGFYFRGDKKCQANIWSQELGSGEINGYRTDKSMPPEVRRGCIPMRKADRPFGEWNAFEITIRGNRMTVVLNGEKVIDAVPLPDLPAEGPIAVQHHGDPVEFRMFWVKELDSQKKKSKTQKK